MSSIPAHQSISRDTSQAMATDSVAWWSKLHWLLLAVFCSVLGERWGMPVLNLIYPFALLMYLRTERTWRGHLIACVSICVPWILFMGDFAPFIDDMAWAMTVVASVVLSLLPFLADRLTHQKLSVYLASLVFPCAMLTVDALRHATDPTGSYGMLGYSVGADNPLAQITAVLGIDALTFLMAWGASIAAFCVANWPDRTSSKQAILRVASVYGVLLCAIWIGGAFALQSSPAPDQSVHIASIAKRGASLGFAEAAKTQEQQLQEWLQLSKQQAKAGAQIIVWGEGALVIKSEFEPQVLVAAQEFAKQENVHLVLAVFHADRVFQNQRHNKLIWIDSEGLLRNVYHKNHGQFAEGTVAGDGKLGLIDTPWGRFALSICWDADFPRFMAQASAQGAVALINPSYDFPAVARGRAVMARFRAIENGVAIIRPNNNGVSFISDGAGRVLSSQTTQSDQVVALNIKLPLSARTTWARHFSAVFSYINILMLGMLIVMAWRRRKNRNSVESIVGTASARS